MSTETGRRAEATVCDWLIRQSFQIVTRNWRTRFCEIDIVATRNSKIYFVEVKYRKTAFQGNGLEYITAKKLKQMKFASDMFFAKYRIEHQPILCAVAVAGDFRILDYIEFN